MTGLGKPSVGLTAEKLSLFTSDVNQAISTYISQQEIVDLGPEYSILTSYDDAQIKLIHYRMAKNWGATDISHWETVRRKSVLDVFSYDRSGPSFSKDTYFSDCDPFTRKTLYEVRNELQEMFRRSYRFRPERMRMPSGESDLSAGGDVSIVAKLRDKEQWRITADCVDLFATVCYKVPALKAAARKHIGKVTKEDAKRLHFHYPYSKHRGYDVFRELLLSEVLTIVPGSRIETVPKERDKQRVISCEPFCNMIVQSVIEEGLRDLIRREFDIDLDTSADIHKVLARDLDNATIDLSNASNSNFNCWIKWFYPSYFTKSLEQSRSPMAVFRENESTTHRHHWNMVSPMGNGFTFGLMTLTLLTIARRMDSFAHVFGDDIIIHRDCAAQLIDTLDFIGFRINESKTFIDGSFRESCGAFTFQGKDLKSFKFEWAEDACGAIVIVNKVLILADHTKDPSLQRLAESLLRVTPSLCKKASAHHGVESRFVLITKRAHLKQKRRCPDITETFKKVSKWRSVRSFCSANQIELCDLDIYEVCTLSAPVYRCRLPVHNANAFWTSHFLYGGRCSAPVIRPSDRNPIIFRHQISYEQFVLRNISLPLERASRRSNDPLFY